MTSHAHDAPPGPLAGVRVVDLTNVLAGPYCSYQLALLGAEVIKIEIPGIGDLARRLGADEELNAAFLGASFLAQNAGKKSVEIDLKTDEGRGRFTELVARSDVLLENFRPGVLARLGFSWPELQEINASLIYCAISGFGQTGPMKDRPAYDQIIQGLSGMMSVTGTPETAPLRAGFPVCDTLAGLAGALAIAAAVAGRARTGRGCQIDVSLLEVAISAMGWVISNFVITGVVPEPMANENFTAAPSGAFETADGLLNVSANQGAQFEALCRVLGRDDLCADPRFCTPSLRKANRAALTRELESVLRTRTAAEWEAALSAAGVPAARVLTVPEVAALDQLAHRGFFHRLPFPDRPDRELTVVGSGVHFDGAPLHASAPPPRLGEHNEELRAVAADLDLLDRRLLHLLGQDAKALASIAQELGLPIADLEQRLHALIDRGVISEVAARIAPDQVGLPITAFYFLRVSQNADDTEAFAALIRDVDQVEEAHAVSGQYDWLVKVRAQSVLDVQDILTQKIAVLPGFVRGETMIVLSTACDRVNVHAALHETL